MHKLREDVFWTRLRFVTVLVALVSIFYSGVFEGAAQALDLPPPLIAHISPGTAEQGQTLELIITGMHFTNGTNVSFSPPDGINGTAVVVVSPMELDVTITVANDTPAGPKDVTVTNPDGQNGTLVGGLTVTEAPLATETMPPLSVAPTTSLATSPKIEVSGIAVTPLQPKAGENVTYTANVANMGTAMAANVTVHLRLDGNEVYGMRVDIPVLSGVTVVYSWLAEPGEHHVVIEVTDAGGASLVASPPYVISVAAAETGLTTPSNTTMGGESTELPVYLIVIIVIMLLGLIIVLVLIFRVKRPAVESGSSGEKTPSPQKESDKILDKIKDLSEQIRKLEQQLKDLMETPTMGPDNNMIGSSDVPDEYKPPAQKALEKWGTPGRAIKSVIREQIEKEIAKIEKEIKELSDEYYKLKKQENKK